MPKEEMEISEAGLALLTLREGCELEAYQDSVGVWTIGVGHTAAAGPPEPCAGMTITEEEAAVLFDKDLDQYEKCVNESIARPMAQFQFDAFVSICFNIGTGGFAGATFVERFNASDIEGCADAILWWDTPSEIVPRRQGEYVQFLSGYVARIQEL